MPPIIPLKAKAKNRIRITNMNLSFFLISCTSSCESLASISAINGGLYGISFDNSLPNSFNEFNSLGKYSDSFVLFDDYFENIMPEFYFKIFKNEPIIVPQKGMDLRLYAHFVVHSIFFFRKKQLMKLSTLPLDLEFTTRQLIASLFTGNE